MDPRYQIATESVQLFQLALQDAGLNEHACRLSGIEVDSYETLAVVLPIVAGLGNRRTEDARRVALVNLKRLLEN